MNDDTTRIEPYAPPEAPLSGNQRRYEFEPIAPAPFWRRAIASFIDLFVIFVIAVACMLALFAAVEESESVERFVVRSMTALITLCPLIIGMVYFVLLTASSFQATLGKLAMRIKVCTLEGGRPCFLVVLVRELCKPPCLFLYVLTKGADISRRFTDGRRMHNRYAHDILSKTSVVLVRPGAR